MVERPDPLIAVEDTGRLELGDLRSLRHNGVPILDYPETHWHLVPFPAQKGAPFQADNLATANDHSFLEDARFRRAREAAESRWRHGGRDISWRLHTFLWAAETAMTLHPEGDLIELGTGHGYMAAGLCAALDWGEHPRTVGRTLHLVDTFESHLPSERGSSAAARFYYADGDLEVRTYFGAFGGVRIHTGLLPDVLSEVATDGIAFAHVDLNHAPAEIDSLHRLPFVTGALVLFDDSGNPGCGEQLAAHRRWAQEVGSTLLQLPTGQGLCILP